MSCPMSNVHVLFSTFDADAPTSCRRLVHTGRQHTGEEFRLHGGKRGRESVRGWGKQAGVGGRWVSGICGESVGLGK